LKSCCVLQDHYVDERDKAVFHNTTLDLQDQNQDQDRFLVWDRSFPKTGGHRPQLFHCPGHQRPLNGWTGNAAPKTSDKMY